MNRTAQARANLAKTREPNPEPPCSKPPLRVVQHPPPSQVPPQSHRDRQSHPAQSHLDRQPSSSPPQSHPPPSHPPQSHLDRQPSPSPSPLPSQVPPQSPQSQLHPSQSHRHGQPSPSPPPLALPQLMAATVSVPAASLHVAAPPQPKGMLHALWQLFFGPPQIDVRGARSDFGVFRAMYEIGSDHLPSSGTWPTR